MKWTKLTSIDEYVPAGVILRVGKHRFYRVVTKEEYDKIRAQGAKKTE